MQDIFSYFTASTVFLAEYQKNVCTSDYMEYEIKSA